MPTQFWVIGAEYRDTEFQEAIDGTSRVFGPFSDYEQARQMWRERSFATRSQAATRYTIVSNVAVRPTSR